MQPFSCPPSGAPGTVVLRPSASHCRILLATPFQGIADCLAAFLTASGYLVFCAADGHRTVEIFQAEKPDLVLLDLKLPIADGCSVAHHIKYLAGDRFVPVLLVSAADEKERLIHCQHNCADDFLTEPLDRSLLLAKLLALDRVLEIQARLAAQNAELLRHQEQQQRDREIAERVFANVLSRRSGLDQPNIRYLLAPVAGYNGDILLAEHAPSGSLYAMLGDFTGHGLSAAIGALPVADIFYGMSAKGFSIADIAAEMNRKIRAILPPGFFLAACLVEMSPVNQAIHAWNGGLPDALLYRPGQGIAQRFISRHLPLGILDDKKFVRSLEVAALSPDDRLFMYSDGLIECRGADCREMYGQERLEQRIVTCEDPGGIFPAILGDTRRFCENGSQEDDITLIEIHQPRYTSVKVPPPVSGILSKTLRPPNWGLDITLHAAALRATDPLPVLVRLVQDLQDIGQGGNRERLYLVLAELFNNALDHGLLHLDSKLKNDPEGFCRFYEMRRGELERISEGWVRVQIEHSPSSSGGSLHIRVHDSGTGFQHAAYFSQNGNELAAHGRGIALVRSLCRKVNFLGAGNRVSVVLDWETPST